jgi:hypothetical protein
LPDNTAGLGALRLDYGKFGRPDPRLRSGKARPFRDDQIHADAVFEAGWDEHALHDAIALTARAAFMQRPVEGHGFVPMSPEAAAKRALVRLERGYVHLYPAFRENK